MQLGTCIQCVRDYSSYLLVCKLLGGETHQDQSCRQITEVFWSLNFGMIAIGSGQVSSMSCLPSIQSRCPKYFAGRMSLQIS